jgi:alkyl sulfatase BDS1-like metallo-beta-lactamase superfamily hydrolase
MLVTGRYQPIVGADVIDAALARLHDAVTYVHEETLAGMNAGLDVFTLMDRIRLPAELRVGQGYGTVAWGVRTIWETYMGWFTLRSTTELYRPQTTAVLGELVELIGVDAVVDRATAKVAAGEPLAAIVMAEAVLERQPGHAGAVDVMIAAHQQLLAAGGDVSFWQSGWLHHQLEHWQNLAG